MTRPAPFKSIPRTGRTGLASPTLKRALAKKALALTTGTNGPSDIFVIREAVTANNPTLIGRIGAPVVALTPIFGVFEP